METSSLDQKAIKEILDLCLTNEEDLDDVKINRCIFRDDPTNSNFWIYWKRSLHLNRGILLWKCVAI